MTEVQETIMQKAQEMANTFSDDFMKQAFLQGVEAGVLLTNNTQRMCRKEELVGLVHRCLGRINWQPSEIESMELVREVERFFKQ